jgi:hypothetical protein
MMVWWLLVATRRGTVTALIYGGVEVVGGNGCAGCGDRK